MFIAIFQASKPFLPQKNPLVCQGRWLGILTSWLMLSKQLLCFEVWGVHGLEPWPGNSRFYPERLKVCEERHCWTLKDAVCFFFFRVGVFLLELAGLWLDPWKLTCWTESHEVLVQMIFLSRHVIFRFHVNFPGLLIEWDSDVSRFQ